MAQLYDAAGNPVGPDFAAQQQYLGNYTPGEAIPLAAGGYALLYTYSGALVPGALLNVASFSSDGQLLATAPLGPPPGYTGLLPVGGQAWLYALPDGGFVAAWAEGQPFSGGPARTVIREFGAAGAPVGDTMDLGAIVSGNPAVQVAADGHFTVSWNSFTGVQHQTFLESAPPVAGTQTTLVVAQDQPLDASGGWSGAAVLSDHSLAVVGVQDGGWGSHVGAAQVYDASGALTASASGVGYGSAGEAFAPEITALSVGGLYEVSFAGSTDYAVYTASGHQAWIHNAYTSPNVSVVPLTSGGYALTDFADRCMGLFDASGANTAWVSLAGYGAPDRTAALSDGGLAVGFGQSLVAFDAAGQVEYTGHLGAAGSGFASQLTALANGQVGEVWLSPDGGQYGLPTTIVFQAFGAQGASGALVLGQDLDPWRTTFAIQAHADGSAAVLWSEGGGIFGAEYGAGSSGAHAAMVGDLSSALAIQLPDDAVGLVQLQGGDVIAEVFDPASGRVARADLGAATGDLSTVHALATAAGGLAVSWRAPSGVVGAVMDPWGGVGTVASLPGDFLGVDGQGRAITLHDVGGQPALETYALNGGGLFWAA
ncbi:MAG: hypothetical protein ACXWKX_01895 [Caulobacteraceae bacterium]